MGAIMLDKEKADELMPRLTSQEGDVLFYIIFEQQKGINVEPKDVAKNFGKKRPPVDVPEILSGLKDKGVIDY